MTRSLVRLLSRAVTILLAALAVIETSAQVNVPIVTLSNVHFRVMAANLNGNSQTYEPFALRIFEGLKPDIVAIQEFNYGNNTPSDIRSMINAAFGTEFAFYRESGYSIPNGVISRWPIVSAGSWEDIDPGVNDRGFAWARIDLPGTNDLYVVSIHLKASSGSSNELRRANEAAQIKSMIQSNFPADVWIVVAGDCNIYAANEGALTTFGSFLSDDPIPTDATTGGNPNTNNNRDRRYDYVFPSPTLNSNHVSSLVGSRTFPNGLVFDSRVYSPLSDVVPVQTADSGLAQHMAVLKDFCISVTVTNLVPVPRPVLELVTRNVIQWEGLSNLTYTLQTTETLTNWTSVAAVSSTTTNFAFTNSQPVTSQLFFRVVYP